MSDGDRVEGGTPGPGIPVGPGPLAGEEPRAVEATEAVAVETEPAVVAADDAVDAAAAADVAAGGTLSEQELEGLLFVAERPLSRREIAVLAGVDRAAVDARLGDLEVSLADRGIRLVLDGDRVVLASAPDSGALIARYVGADAIRLTPASLETLAIVAYRQPVTKAAVERIRGVDSDYTIRTLLHRRLIVELGRSDAPGRPYLYGTGLDFLERFGLTSLEELPPLDVDVAARLAEEGADAAPTLEVDGAGAMDPTDPTDPTVQADPDDPTVASPDRPAGSAPPSPATG